MLFGGYWFEVLPEDYVIQFNLTTKKCSLCLSGFDRNYWILGDAFMRGLYTVHDYDNLRMGFVPYTGSAKGAMPAKTTDPTTTPPGVDVVIAWSLFGLTATQFILITAFVVVLVATIVLLALFCFSQASKQLLKASKLLVRAQKVEKCPSDESILVLLP